MKYLIAPVVIALVAALFCVAGPASSEDGAAPPPKAPTMQDMKELFEKAGRTGPRHEELKYFLGDWDVKLAMMGAPPVPGTATFSWAIEGRWLLQKLTSTMMGKPLEQVSLSGYDMYAKAHVTASATNLDTAMLVSRGSVVDPKHQLTVQYGTLHEYMTGELYKPYKAVTKKLDDNHFTMEVWDLGIGEAGRVVLSYHYTRAKR